MAPKRFSPGFLDALMCHDWPGNIRELINALEKAMSGARHEPCLHTRHLPTELRVRIVESQMTGEPAAERFEALKSGELGSGTGGSSSGDLAPADAAVPVGSLEAPGISPGATGKDFPKLKDSLDIREMQYLQDLLNYTQGNVAQAARISGLSRARLYVRLKQHHLSTVAAAYRAAGRDTEDS
jgi:two-component system NtrC family response regulator